MKFQSMNKEILQALLPVRALHSHKGDYGKLLMLCGSEGYTGAAALAAKAALRTGAGLVYLGTARCIYAIEAVKLTEPVVFPLPDRDGGLSFDALPDILQRLPSMDACLIGCGLGRNQETAQLVRELLTHITCPLVLDADGINAVAENINVLRGAACPVILTPHEGEFRRLGGKLDDGRAIGAIKLAKETRSIVVLKGHETVITDGQETYVNHTGNPGMAVGGSGDVLAGIIASLLGQKLAPLTAAAAAVWLHGSAGDMCAQELGQYGMLPGDMIRALPRLLR